MVESIPRILAMLYRMATQQPVGQSNSLSDVKGVNRFLLGWESQITTLKLDNIKPLGFSNVPLYRCAFYDIGLFLSSFMHVYCYCRTKKYSCVKTTNNLILKIETDSCHNYRPVPY